MIKDKLSGSVVERVHLKRRKPKPISRRLKFAVIAAMVWVCLSEWLPTDLFIAGICPIGAIVLFEYMRWKRGT